MSEVRMDHIMQVGLGFWASKTLLSAVEMELFTELAKHPEDLAAIEGRLGLHPRSSRDFLDTLVALGFLERRDGKYYNTRSTDFFLDKRKPSYIGGMLEMANQRLYAFWNHLTVALRTGEQQNEGKGGGPNFFGALYADPAKRALMNEQTQYEVESYLKLTAPGCRKLRHSAPRGITPCGVSSTATTISRCLRHSFSPSMRR